MNIMHQDLHLYSYKIQILQLQTDANNAEKFAFGHIISDRIEDHPLPFRNDVNFHLSGDVNQQNMRFWAQAQPHKNQNRPRWVEKVTV